MWSKKLKFQNKVDTNLQSYKNENIIKRINSTYNLASRVGLLQNCNIFYNSVFSSK